MARAATRKAIVGRRRSGVVAEPPDAEVIDLTAGPCVSSVHEPCFEERTHPRKLRAVRPVG